MPICDATDFQSFIKFAPGILSVFDTPVSGSKNECSPNGKIKPAVRSLTGASYMENGVWQYWADQKPVAEMLRGLIIQLVQRCSVTGQDRSNSSLIKILC